MQYGDIGSLGSVEVAGLHVTSISDPAVSGSSSTGLVDRYCAVAAIVPEVVACANFDAV